MNYETLSYGAYQFPLWANTIGWLISTYVITTIPLTAVIKLIKADGKNCWSKAVSDSNYVRYIGFCFAADSHEVRNLLDLKSWHHVCWASSEYEFFLHSYVYEVSVNASMFVSLTSYVLSIEKRLPASSWLGSSATSAPYVHRLRSRMGRTRNWTEFFLLLACKLSIIFLSLLALPPPCSLQ